MECFTHLLGHDATDICLKVGHNDYVTVCFFFKENLVISSPGNPRPVVFRFMQDCLSTPNLFRSTKREEPYREEESPVVSQKFLISSQEMPLAVPYSALCLARFRVYFLEKLT